MAHQKDEYLWYGPSYILYWKIIFSNSSLQMGNLHKAEEELVKLFINIKHWESRLSMWTVQVT